MIWQKHIYSWQGKCEKDISIKERGCTPVFDVKGIEVDLGFCRFTDFQKKGKLSEIIKFVGQFSRESLYCKIIVNHLCECLNLKKK